jgi:hypothetical protein
VRAGDSKKSIFLWLPFFCCFRQKKVTRRFSGGSFWRLILVVLLRSFKLEQSFRPLTRPGYFLLLAQKKANQRKGLP